MGFPVHIRGTDPSTGNLEEASVEQRPGHAGVVAWTAPVHENKFFGRRAFNETYGTNIAQDASPGGTPVLIHDGIDTVAWTGSSIAGTSVDFNDSTRPLTGTFSVHVDSPGVGEVWQFDRGSDIDLTNYVSITININVDRRWNEGDSISVYGWDTGTGTQVGVKVFLEDFINETNFDVWQTASIPLGFMCLAEETIDAIRMEVEAVNGQSPDFYIDDMQVEEQGDPIVFTAEPPVGGIFYVTNIRVTVTDTLDISVANGTAPGLTYNKLLGLPQLSSGLVVLARSEGETLFSLALTSVGDLLEASVFLSDVICDGTTTTATFDRKLSTSPIKLVSSKGDLLSFTISEDLSGLDNIQVSITGYRHPDHVVAKPHVNRGY